MSFGLHRKAQPLTPKHQSKLAPGQVQCYATCNGQRPAHAPRLEQGYIQIVLPRFNYSGFRVVLHGFGMHIEVVFLRAPDRNPDIAYAAQLAHDVIEKLKGA